jgi:ATP phosphoribosyltransferase
VEVERNLDVSSRLVVNQAALKLKREPLRQIIGAFADAVKAREAATSTSTPSAKETA